MKKRMLSLLLAGTMIVSLFSPLAETTAYAETTIVSENGEELDIEPAVQEISSTPVLEKSEYSVVELENLRVFYNTEYTSSDIEDCVVEDSSIASVTTYEEYDYILINGLKRGTTTLTISKTNGEVENYKINVTPRSFEITQKLENDKIHRGLEKQIEVTEGFEEYNWSVDNESIIKLNPLGSNSNVCEVKALRNGTATITVTNEYGDTINYNVTVYADEFTINGSTNPTIALKYNGIRVSLNFDNNLYKWSDCTYEFEDSNIAYVDAIIGNKLYIKASNVGDTVLTVTNQYNESVTCQIHVYQKLDELSFTEDEYTVWMGQTLKLTHNESPANSNNRMTYAVSEAYRDYISVSEDGVVTPLKPGTGNRVRIQSECGEVDYCEVTVEAPYFAKSTYNMYIKKTLQLKLNGGRSDTTWISSNTAVATVSSSGKVTAKKVGTTTITANTGGYKVKTTVKVSNPTISKTSATLKGGSTLTLKITGGTGTVKWTSSNTKVATVNSSGKVTAKNTGTATISAKVSGVTLKCKITVKRPTISKTSASLWAGNTLKLKITNGYGTTKWTSSNTKVATVSSTGKVTAKKVGTATITAKVSGVSLKCKITVKAPKLSKTSKTLIAKQTFKLSVKGTINKITWSSSNTKVATVSSSGKVTAKNAGTATIYAKVDGRTLKCKLTVKKNQISYSVDTDADSYYYGEPVVELKKAYFEGNVLKTEWYVINARMFEAEKFDWITLKLYDDDYNLIAKKKFYDIKLNLDPYDYKKITVTFSGDAIKNKNAILNNGVYFEYEYWYTYIIN